MYRENFSSVHKEGLTTKFRNNRWKIIKENGSIILWSGSLTGKILWEWVSHTYKSRSILHTGNRLPGNQQKWYILFPNGVGTWFNPTYSVPTDQQLFEQDALFFPSCSYPNVLVPHGKRKPIPTHTSWCTWTFIYVDFVFRPKTNLSYKLDLSVTYILFNFSKENIPVNLELKNTDNDRTIYKNTISGFSEHFPHEVSNNVVDNR